MDPLVELIFNLTQDLILLLTLATIAYAIWRLRHDRWYLRHALPMLVYSVHVAIYYLALVAHDVVPFDMGVASMAWSIALRLHGAIMVFIMTRTVITCYYQTN